MNETSKQKLSSIDELEELCNNFRDALFESLCEAERKHGWNGQWKRDGWRDTLNACLRENLLEGDALKVAAYAAFAWHHGWSLSDGYSIDDRYTDNTDSKVLLKDARDMVKHLNEISERLYSRGINTSLVVTGADEENYIIGFTQKL